MYALNSVYQIISEYVSTSASAVSHGKLFTFLNPFRLAACIWCIGYVLIQEVIIAIFKPPKPPKELPNPRGRIAVIGAGVTGVSSAAHALAHGFEVVIFEQGGEEDLGGIWARVNSTSGLQLNSLLYRFHPGVLWKRAFPLRDEVLEQIKTVWTDYNLDTRTRFNTKVTSVRRASEKAASAEDPDRSRWIVNDGAEGVFDAIIVSIGTCGEPNWVKLPGMPERKDDGTDVDREEDNETHHSTPNDEYGGLLLHSAELDSPKLKKAIEGGARVVVIGSGASGVEAVETLLEKTAGRSDVDIALIARHDKWIIPRNTVIDTAIAGQPFGREMPFSIIWEWFLGWWQYKGIDELVPNDVGIYEGTPVVNDVFLGHIKHGRCRYIRGQPVRLTKDGILVEPRKHKPRKYGQKGNESVEDIEEGEERELPADVVVFATGYKKPSTEFLPKDLFPQGYERPDLYLQNFSTEDWSVLMTNSSYMNAIGTVGHFHIGIYTRILLTLLLDKNARPTPKDMKLWVDVLRFVKRGATGGALGFFTYMELTIWLLLFHLFRPDRVRWLFFIMNGWGVYAR